MIRLIPCTDACGLVVLASRHTFEVIMVDVDRSGGFFWGRVLFDEKGQNKEKRDNLSIRSFYDFSDQDKMWLLRDCCWSRAYLSEVLLLGVYDKTIKMPSVEDEYFMTKWHQCIYTLDVDWNHIPKIFDVLQTPSIASLTYKQAANFVADQLSLNVLNQNTVVPEWFQYLSSYHGIRQLWKDA